MRDKGSGFGDGRGLGGGLVVGEGWEGVLREMEVFIMPP